MTMENLHESLNRTVKLAIDSGEAASIEEAENIFRGYCLAIEIGPDVAESSTLQAMVLTTVNTARRCFLGGVYVAGAIEVPLQVQWRRCRTLAKAVNNLGGNVVNSLPNGVPRLIIGDVPHPTGTGEFVVQTTFDGWSGGIIPLENRIRLPEKAEFVPAGVLAGALGVSEAFQYVRNDNLMAGRREVGISLWNPSAGQDWCTPGNIGPAISHLPSKMWVIGLGHLGQAFLWTLGLLSYERPEEVLLTLQDFDVLSKANDSTSLLTFSPETKNQKTRAMSKWCEERGFCTQIIERRFTEEFQILSDEPTVAICGVDNALGRAALEDVGFGRVIEAGLGKEANEYLSFQVHTFPGPQNARRRWGGTASHQTPLPVADKPAYEALAHEGMDECGITTLAGRTVGASFVGTVAATFMVAELLRMIHGGTGYAIVDGSLRCLKALAAIENVHWRKPFNPGITGSAS